MDDPALRPDLERELSELRARAYGPHPDIQDDPAALSRLRELEEAHIRSVMPKDAVVLEPAGAIVGSKLVHGEAVSGPTHATDSATESGVRQGTDPLGLSRGSHVSRRRLTTSRRAMVSAGAVVIVLAVASAVTWVVQPHPDATLRPTSSTVDDEVPVLYAEALRQVDSSTLLAYESYRGLEPLVGVNGQGFPCLAAINLEEHVFFGVSCTPPGVDPWIEVTVLANRDDFFEDEFPEGSVIRLTLHHDVVEVFVHPAPQAD
jgi:hypothetical protein